MIKDKNADKIQHEPVPEDKTISLPEQVSLNPLSEAYWAVKRALLTIKDSSGEPFFRFIGIDTGQFERIALDKNYETEIPFPACFIHFTNVRYLVQQQRIGEGRATLRIRFILNNLNNQDTDMECMPFDIFQRVNVAVQDAKNHEPALNERLNLLYFDMPTTANMLQAYWVDYEIWFRETSAWKYRDWVEKYLVIPPFTNHDDAPERDEEQHGNHNKPKYKEVSSFLPSVEEDEISSEENTD